MATFRTLHKRVRLGAGMLLLAALAIAGIAAAQFISWRRFMQTPASRPTVAHRGGTQLIILGTTHAPHASLDLDSLYAALEILKPDVILFEGDSAYLPQLRRPPGLRQALEVALRRGPRCQDNNFPH